MLGRFKKDLFCRQPFGKTFGERVIFLQGKVKELYLSAVLA